MKCGICGRSHEQIIEECVILTKVTSSTEVEVFYLASTNQLICSRCASEKLIPLSYRGKPYLKYHVESKKYRKMKGIKVDTSPIVLEDDDTISNREVSLIESRDKIEKMMAQI